MAVRLLLSQRSSRLAVGGMPMLGLARPALSSRPLAPCLTSTLALVSPIRLCAQRTYATTPAPRPSSPPPSPSTKFSPSGPSSPREATQGGPRPRPPTPPRTPRPGWVNMLVTAQLVIFGVSLLGIGYYIARATNAASTTTAAETVLPSTALKPSIMAISEQEANQPSYGTKEDYALAIRELKEMWARKGNADRVSTDGEDLEVHGISDWSYHDAQRPTVVVWVESTEEVQEVVLLARRYRVPITPFSGGTSLEGHFSSVSCWVLSRTVQGLADWILVRTAGTRQVAVSSLGAARKLTEMDSIWRGWDSLPVLRSELRLAKWVQRPTTPAPTLAAAWQGSAGRRHRLGRKDRAHHAASVPLTRRPSSVLKMSRQSPVNHQDSFLAYPSPRPLGSPPLSALSYS